MSADKMYFKLVQMLGMYRVQRVQSKMLLSMVECSDGTFAFLVTPVVANKGNTCNDPKTPLTGHNFAIAKRGAQVLEVNSNRHGISKLQSDNYSLDWLKSI